MPRLYKKEKLCSQASIDRLFSLRYPDSDSFGSALSFPLRCVWQINLSPRRSDSPIQFLISIPKRKIRHAVDRVTMRRRVREAYRLNRDNFNIPPGLRLDVAFIYVDNRLRPYSSVEKAMRNLLSRLSQWSDNSDNSPCLSSPQS